MKLGDYIEAVTPIPPPFLHQESPRERDRDRGTGEGVYSQREVFGSGGDKKDFMTLLPSEWSRWLHSEGGVVAGLYP